jgi:hypothetical protein
MGKKLIPKPAAAAPAYRPFFRAGDKPVHGWRSQAFFQLKHEQNAVVQRQQEEVGSAEAEEEKDPVSEGLKKTGSQLLKNPQFKLWYKPKLELLKDTLWESRTSEEQAAIITYGALSLGTAGLAFSQSPEFRELLSGVNIGAPLGWIPYSPIKGFKYKLPKEGKSDYGFSAEFTLDPYLKLLSERYPGQPWTGASFGLDTAYTPGQGVSVTGGKFGLGFWGGALKAEGKTFKELSAYPQYMPGDMPGTPPAWLMHSVPELPPLHKGPGFQFMLTLDFAKLVDRMKNEE